jgi:hypothetical protein
VLDHNRVAEAIRVASGPVESATERRVIDRTDRRGRSRPAFDSFPPGHAVCGFGQLAESAVAGTNAGEGQNGNVIILPKRYRFRGRLLGAGLVGKENGLPVEAIKLARDTARFEQTIDVEGEMIALPELTREFLVNGRGKNT